MDTMLSHAQVQQFKIDGYLVLPGLLAPEQLTKLKNIALSHLEQRIEPFELEADVHYPGAPANTQAQGGTTIRRLQMAYQRDDAFKALACNTDVSNAIKQILNTDQLWLNPCHHNCVMTKQPDYSSETLWHRDTRYWHFDNKYLINAWFALGNEKLENGAMKILPGSHRWDVRDEALDKAQFLITEHPDNKYRMITQRLVELNAGDALLFSAHCFHAAGKNTTDQSKYSAVFTYHSEQTQPIEQTHSASLAEIMID